MEDTDKRSTLIKSRTGKVRTSVYKLPSKEFVYGCPSVREESAGSVISKWTTSQPHHMQPKKNFIAQNANREQENNTNKINEPATELVYGMKTRFAAETMKDLVESEFALQEDELDYPKIAVIKREEEEIKKKLPPPRENKTTTLRRQMLLNNNHEDDEDIFKMSKFKKVPSKVKLQMGNIPRNRPQTSHI